MKKILFLNACVRPNSRTLVLAQHVLSKLDGTVEEVNLEKERIAPLDWESLQERDSYCKNGDFSAPMFRHAHKFAQADEIVIAAPYWDLAFPSTVRIYFEAVTVCGLSFEYSVSGAPQGLCRAKRIHYVTTSGGAIGEYNLGFDYIKALCRSFYGIPEVLCYRAENLDIQGSDVKAIMDTAIAEANEKLK